MTKKCCYNNFLMIFFEEERTKTSKDKRMVKLDFLIFFPSWSFLLIHIQFTRSEDLKNLVDLIFIKKPDHGSWTMGKDHLIWSDVTVHGVNRP